MPTLAASGLLLPLLATATGLHGLALLIRRPWGSRLLTGAAQALLLLALVGASIRALGTSDPATWPPAQTRSALAAAVATGLLIYLVAGYWWRSVMLGVTMAFLLFILAALQTVAPSASLTRGLTLDSVPHTVFVVLSPIVVATALVGLAILLARLGEQHRLGQAVMSAAVAGLLLALGTVLRVVQVGLSLLAWRAGDPWTVNHTWLVSTAILLALSVMPATRGRSLALPLVTLAVGMLLAHMLIVLPLSGRPA